MKANSLSLFNINILILISNCIAIRVEKMG